jgi:small subunit ribosomal protein S1
MITGKIKSITDFGIFIGLDGGIDGLVHLNDISWTEPGEGAIRNLKKGDELTSVILAIDPERERISLGLKQLEKDNFASFVEQHGKNSIVTGTVSDVDAKGATVDLADDIKGYLKAGEISADKIKDASEVLKVGDEVEAKIINIDRKSRSIQLSIKAKETQEQADTLRQLNKQADASTATLGDLMKEQIGSKDSH